MTFPGGRTVRFYAVRLWTLQRWIRWTGFRLCIQTPTSPDDGPTVIGFLWYGWGFIGNEPARGRWPE